MYPLGDLCAEFIGIVDAPIFRFFLSNTDLRCIISRLIPLGFDGGQFRAKRNSFGADKFKLACGLASQGAEMLGEFFVGYRLRQFRAEFISVVDAAIFCLLLTKARFYSMASCGVPFGLKPHYSIATPIHFCGRAV